MKLMIDISKDRYDEIMSMDWKNCRRFFDEELRAIHDGKVLEQEPSENVPDLYECPCGYGWDKNKVVRHHFCPNCGRAVDGSIKTEQEPCEDCISRQAVLNTLDDMDNVLDEDRTVETYKMLLTECVNVLPSVTPAEKVGQWIDVDGIWFKCSECDAHRKMMPAYKEYYCPNCGCKMQEVEE